MNTKGGNAPIYLSNNMIRFDDNSKLKSTEGFGIDGSLVDLTLVKSRSNKAGQTATLVFNQFTGFDPELSLFLMLKDNDRVKGAGAYLYIGDRSDMKFAQKNLKNKLLDDAEFRDVFMAEVISVLKGNMEEESQSISTQSSNITDMILQSLREDAA